MQKALLASVYTVMCVLAMDRRARYACLDCLCGGSDVGPVSCGALVARAFVTTLSLAGDRRNAGIGSDFPPAARISIPVTSPRPLVP